MKVILLLGKTIKAEKCCNTKAGINPAVCTEVTCFEAAHNIKSAAVKTG